VERSERLLVSAKSLVLYLAYTVFPVGLIPYYQYPYPRDISVLFWDYAAPVALVITGTAAAVLAARRHPLWPALWGYYVVTLFPVLGVVQVGAQSMADRYFYLPGIAPLLAAGLGASVLYERVRSATGSLRTAGISLAAAALLVLAPLSVLTVRQIAVWNNTLVLWSTVKQHDPNVHLAYVYTGLTYLRQGRYDDAVSELSTAIRLNEVHTSAHNFLGVAYYKMGRLDDAIEKYRYACYLDPRYVQAHLNLGLAYFKRGDIEDAIREYETALSLDPDYAKAQYNLGLAYERQGRLPEAVSAYRTALSLNPYFEEARDGLLRTGGGR
jgi:tetratricopeptide (TPR) repeat protein